MVQKSSTEEIVRITSARKNTELKAFSDRYDMTHPDGTPILRPSFRQTDPDSTVIGELGPDALSHRVVIRSREFLGTVYGTLLAIDPHPTLAHFTTVQLYGKRELTFRNDTEVLVVG